MKKIAPLFNDNGLCKKTLLKKARSIARHAGDIIMKHYNLSTKNISSINIKYKDDSSPVTKADLDSNNYIVASLKKLTPQIPIVSEENDVAVKPNLPHWSIDPLDGTKLFIAHTGGFAVNIALMLDGRPALGVVYCPAYQTMYYTVADGPSYKKMPGEKPKIIKSKNISNKNRLSTLFDKAHAEEKIYNKQRIILKKSRNLNLTKNPQTIRSLPSNLLVAEGAADLHIKTGKDPSLKKGSGKTWDNAADYLILKNAGGIMVQIHDGMPLKFNKGRERMPAYIAFGDKSFGINIFPELKNHC